jgi:hypothetical protein
MIAESCVTGFVCYCVCVCVSLLGNILMLAGDKLVVAATTCGSHVLKRHEGQLWLRFVSDRSYQALLALGL